MIIFQFDAKVILYFCIHADTYDEEVRLLAKILSRYVKASRALEDLQRKISNSIFNLLVELLHS